MYNKDRKETYIGLRSDPLPIERRTRNWLERAAGHEKELGKDICDWNRDEILEYLTSLKCSKINTLLVIANCFKLYTDWCISEGISKGRFNAFNEIDDSRMIVSCLDMEEIRSHIVSRAEVLNKLGDVLNASDRFIVLAAFEGFDNEEIAFAKPRDFNGNIFKSQRRILKISDELCTIVREASAEEQRKTNRGKGGDLVLEDLVPGDELVRPVLAYTYQLQENPNVFITNRYQKAAQQIGWNITMGDLRDSGRLYMIKCLMAENNIPMHVVLGTDNLRKQVEDIYGIIKRRKSFCSIYENM